MDKKLKGIIEKFDIVQRFNDNSLELVTQFMGFMNELIKLGKPFEYFYDAAYLDSTLGTFNDYLYADGCNAPPITEEDMRDYYEFLRKKFNE
ncbi:hypothetical protein CL621_03975 [archaeon]|nr:hypothetical protein [archaeon]